MICIQTFSHPDYTVGFGIAPNLSPRQREADEGLAGLLPLHLLREHTAGRELHPAPKVSMHHYATKLEHAARADINDFLPGETLPHKYSHAARPHPLPRRTSISQSHQYGWRAGSHEHAMTASCALWSY